jgi:hypothetical protein
MPGAQSGHVSNPPPRGHKIISDAPLSDQSIVPWKTSSALENEADVLKTPAPQLVFMDHEIYSASAAKRDTTPFLGVDLQQQWPICGSRVVEANP